MSEQNKKEQPKTLTFKLSAEIKYGDDGNMTSTKTLVLYSPSRAELKLSRRLKQLLLAGESTAQGRIMGHVKLTKEFAESIKEGEKTRVPDASLKLLPSSHDEKSRTSEKLHILQSIYSCESSLDDFFLNFRRLMCTQCCRLNDRVHMTSTLFERIPPEDDDRLAAEYCEFFLTLKLSP